VRDAWVRFKAKQAEYLAQLAMPARTAIRSAQIQRIKEIEAAQLESDKKCDRVLGKVIEQKIRAAGGSEADVGSTRQRTQAAIDALDDSAATARLQTRKGPVRRQNERARRKTRRSTRKRPPTRRPAGTRWKRASRPLRDPETLTSLTKSGRRRGVPR